MDWLLPFQPEAGKGKTSLYHSIYNGNVLHLEMQDHVGLVGMERNGMSRSIHHPGVAAWCQPPKHALLLTCFGSHTCPCTSAIAVWLCGCRSVSQHEGQTWVWWDQSFYRTHWQCKPLIKSVVHGETPVKDLLKAWHYVINESAGAAKLGRCGA